jgi:hypothetical protein
VSRQYDPIALEILKMARELVLNEYTDRRAQDHNKWLADFESVWKNTRVRLPYPDIPPYPTETEIVKRAQTLMDFIHDNYTQTTVDNSVVETSVVDDQEIAVILETEIEKEESLEEVVEEAIREADKQTAQLSISTQETNETVAHTKEKSDSGFPSFFRKLTS